MRQVPFGIIGDGRAARHMAQYLTLLGISFRQWSRRASSGTRVSPARALGGCRTLLILIQDAAIEPFLLEQGELSASADFVVHFSGSLSTPLALGAHPLMTFGPALYALETYRSIPFVHDPLLEFAAAFPELLNPRHAIPVADKALYHAFCVLSGNFTALLWSKFFREIRTRWGIPAEAAWPYLRKVSENLLTDPALALTGPLARGDWATIERNLDALAGVRDPYEAVYSAFLRAELGPLENHSVTAPAKGSC